MDPSLILALAKTCEALVNKALAYDPASLQKASELKHILAIECTSPSITLYCYGDRQGLVISSHCETPITTTLKGSPLALLSLLKQPTNLAHSGVELQGSIGLLQQWQQLLQQLEIDWEDALHQMLGDIAGPMTADALRSGASWAQQQQQEQQRLMTELLTEEIHVLPTQMEADHLFSDIRKLAEDTDRLSARIQKLQKSLSKTECSDSDA